MDVAHNAMKLAGKNGLCWTSTPYSSLCVLTYRRGELTPSQRIDYTDAVLCMQKQPQHLPREEFPGVRNRFDDFVAYVLAVHDSYTNMRCELIDIA